MPKPPKSRIWTELAPPPKPPQEAPKSQLWICAQSTGHESIIETGPHLDMIRCLQREDSHHRDVWVIDHNGIKWVVDDKGAVVKAPEEQPTIPTLKEQSSNDPAIREFTAAKPGLSLPPAPDPDDDAFLAFKMPLPAEACTAILELAEQMHPGCRAEITGSWMVLKTR